MSNLKNEIFNDRYILIKEIGSGSFSTVWLTFDIITTKYKALKIQNSKDYEDAKYELCVHDYMKKNNINSNHLMLLDDNFVKIDEDDEDEKNICMIMDLMSCSTHNLIKTNLYKTGLPFDIVMKITKQVLVGLSELHKNKMIHKDIKPENILICDLSNKTFEKIKNKMKMENIVKKNTTIKKGKTHFNIKNILSEVEKINDSSVSEESKKSQSQNTLSSNLDTDSSEDNDYLLSNLDKNIKVKIADMGHCMIPTKTFNYQKQSNYYLAPELIMNLEFNESVDMWALGCTIYELLTGKILFDSESYDGNTYRHHLYMVAEKLGMFSAENMNKCEYKDIFFDKRCRCIKGYRSIKFIRPMWKELEYVCKIKNVNIDETELFVDFMMSLFRYDINKRLDAINALNHKLFSLY